MPVFPLTERTGARMRAPAHVPGFAAALVALCGIVALGAMWALEITNRPIEKDAAQTTLMAVNLAHHGVISLDERPPLAPSDYREPIPVLVSALAIELVDAVQGRAAPTQYLRGPRVRQLKYQNLAWLALLSGGASWAARRLTASAAFGALAVLLVNLPFIGHGGAQFVDDLYTDIAAAAVLVWASAALSVAFLTRRRTWLASAGLLLGTLTLIKAATLYVVAALALSWLGVRLARAAAARVPATAALRAGGSELAVLLAAFACTIAPWMIRNAATLGSFELSQRAGVVLMYRALHDEMTPREYVGGFYAWAPRFLAHPLGALLGFSPADLQRGGALQRLNDGDSDFAAADLAAEQAGRPQDAISFYRQARAQREYWEERLSAEHLAQPDTRADALLKARALAIIATHPLRHLALTALFLWRGSAKTFPLLVLALVLAVRRQRDDLGAFVLPALALVLLYALSTHFVPRYDVPPRAVAAVAVAVLAKLGWDLFRSRRALRVSVGFETQPDRAEARVGAEARAGALERLSIAQYARFLTVGGMVGLASVAARDLFQHLMRTDTPQHYSTSVIAAYGLGIVASFALNRRFTFADARDRAPWRTFAGFALLALAGLGCTWLLSLALRYGLPVERALGRAGPDAAFAVAAMLSTAATYPLNARFVFGPSRFPARPRPSAPRAADCSSSRRGARRPQAAR